MEPGVAQRRQQLDGVGLLQVEQGMGDRADVAQRDEPAEAHRQPALEGRAALHLPAVEQPQQAGQKRGHDQHAADEAMGEAAVHRQRRPADPAEQDVDVGHVGAEDQRRQPLAALVLSPAWPSAQPVSEWVKLSTWCATIRRAVLFRSARSGPWRRAPGGRASCPRRPRHSARAPRCRRSVRGLRR